MLGKNKVPISKQLHANFYPLIYFLRLFGIFPLKVEKSETDLFLKWSPCYAVYSYAFGLITIISAIYGEINDVLVKGEVTIDIVSNTDFLATWVVLLGYCIATFIGIFIIGNKHAEHFEFITCLNEVDRIIESHSIKTNKKSSVLLPVLLFTTSGTVYIVTMVAYYRVIGNVVGLLVMIVKRYNPLILNIYVGLMTQCMIRHFGTCLENRFAWLNKILIKECKNVKNGCDGIKNVVSIKRYDYENNKTSVISLVDNKVSEIPRLCQAYIKLLKAASILNNLFGISILIVIVSVFFGLVRTIYYIILLLQGKRGGILELLMRLSIISHQLVRTLFITEPLYWCKVEMQATGKFVSNLLPENIKTHYRKEVNRFIVSIRLLQHQFSACGLLDIDRSLVTVLIESITTYVVILLQAQATDVQ